MPSIYILSILFFSISFFIWYRRKNLFGKYSRTIGGGGGGSRASFGGKISEARRIMPILLTLALTGSCLYIILSQNFEIADVKWSYGIIGSIMGYWMKN